MFLHKNFIVYSLAFCLLGGFLHGKGIVNIGLEACKYPSNYVFSREFDKKHIDLVVSEIESDAHNVLTLVSNGSKEEIAKYIDLHCTVFSLSPKKETFEKFLKPLLIKFASGGAILAGQQIFPEHHAEKFRVTYREDEFSDLFLSWGHPAETGMRASNNALCSYYGIRAEGWTWVKRNALRLCLLLIPMFAKLSSSHDRYEWISWFINRVFDLKDYECYCQNTLMSSIVDSRELLEGLLQRYVDADGNQEEQDAALADIRSFVKESYDSIPMARRVIQMDSFSKYLLAVAVKEACVLALPSQEELKKMKYEAAHKRKWQCYNSFMTYLQGMAEHTLLDLEVEAEGEEEPVAEEIEEVVLLEEKPRQKALLMY